MLLKSVATFVRYHECVTGNFSDYVDLFKLCACVLVFLYSRLCALIKCSKNFSRHFDKRHLKLFRILWWNALKTFRGTMTKYPQNFSGHYDQMPSKNFGAFWSNVLKVFLGTLIKYPQNFSGHFDQMPLKLFEALGPKCSKALFGCMNWALWNWIGPQYQIT
jgi:hypothetical protein